MTGVRSQELADTPTGDLRCRCILIPQLSNRLPRWICRRGKKITLRSQIRKGMFSYERKGICPREKQKDGGRNTLQEGNESIWFLLALAEYLVEFSAPHELNNRIPPHRCLC